MVAACQEMAVYCFDSLLSHFTGTPPPSPGVRARPPSLFVTWKKVLSNGETRLRGCIGTLEPRCILSGFRGLRAGHARCKIGASPPFSSRRSTACRSVSGTCCRRASTLSTLPAG